ncbi:MAG: putative GTP cyclohydrolase 1 type 2 [Pelotomaculum sp. PtaB.Bin013]|uniref:GTP cyclohydrolase 1 type 2 homolog n=1 Tax=Pelotomaculum isophthalicicum JI TaxID=947010 RepID=A0A9X4JTP8_9FIRM|nr:Nif3-like dinuclear metal center hexameric protein [Pelotomaculum isophthalicicum]MDF9409099.1 Nif3-like dinuclear metal center hexameric protein [Pelotomaculum isophthalicicum JI]OPX82980.1 MAG: putative GTP cyclohydrolase 1 type 2 [Pelotomaculum sp. PtaB.Bin013]
MSVKCRDIFNLIEKLAPTSIAEGWDNPGLQVGDPHAEIETVMLTLDINIDVVKEAKLKGAGLIISHHPLIFKPLKSLRLDQPSGKLVEYIIKNNITVYAAHTNLDVASGGVNSVLAEKLGLSETTVLEPAGREQYVKLVVFIPAGHVEDVHQAISGAGAGWIGNYSHCAFQTEGTGMFQPLAGTKPYIGEQGKLEQVKEVRLETIVPTNRLDAVIQAMLKTHPYEEVAYDLYSLENPGPAYGLGRVGGLACPVSFLEFAQAVKKALGLPAVRLGGEAESKVKKVAVCGGAGAKLWPAALRAGADTFVTGDINHHEAQDMLAAGLNFIDAGHHGSESVVLPALKEYLERQCISSGLNVKVTLSDINTNPFSFI